jgi:cytochrome c oxidase assembly protein Cox11
MPVRFYIATDLPQQIRTLTLSYTFFQVPSS